MAPLGDGSVEPCALVPRLLDCHTRTPSARRASGLRYTEPHAEITSTVDSAIRTVGRWPYGAQFPVLGQTFALMVAVAFPFMLALCPCVPVPLTLSFADSEYTVPTVPICCAV